MTNCINCKNNEEHIEVFVKIIDYIAQDNQRLRDQNKDLKSLSVELQSLVSSIRTDLQLIRSGSV